MTLAWGREVCGRLGISDETLRRWVKVAWCMYPVLVTFVVVATANHFLVDVFLGVLTAVIAALLADRLLARARPEAWAFGSATA